jgi:hypothetical protein
MTIDGLLILIKKLLNLRLKCSLTIHFGDDGTFKLETRLMDDSTNFIFQKYLN